MTLNELFAKLTNVISEALRALANLFGGPTA